MEITNDTGLKAGWCIGRVPPFNLTATLLVKGTFRIVPGGAATALPEKEQVELSGDLHLDDDPERAMIYSSDFALAKAHSDILLAGQAHAPEGRPVTALRIGMRIGGFQRPLLVIGPRRQEKGILGGRTGDPEPFVAMPLTWEQCYGGPGFAQNPLGLGAQEDRGGKGGTKAGARTGRDYPNLVRPAEAGADAGTRLDPAGVGPIPMMWPQRLEKVGTFDRAWLEKNWPWFPDDFDWSFFNSAPVEQQLREFLRGDEPVAFENLHPEFSNLAGRLPGLRARWFVVDRHEGGERFREIPMHMDTLWVQPDELKLVLIWRGILDVQSKQMREVLDHYIVCEPLDSAPHSLAHYAAELPIRKALLGQEAEIEADEEAAAGETDPLDFAPVELPAVGWEDAMEKEFAAVEGAANRMADEAARHHAGLAKALAPQGISLPPIAKPEPTSDLAYLAMAQDAWDRIVAVKPEFAAEMARPDDPDFGIKIPDIDDTLPPDEAEEIDEDDIKWTRELVIEAVAAGRGLSGRELNGLDLSGLNLAGVDFTEAVLEGTNLDGADLTGARLERALLVKASLEGASLAGAELKLADLTGANLVRADLSGCRAEAAEFSGATLGGANLSSLDAPEALFNGADLAGARLVDARLAGAEFDAAQVIDADFSGATLTDASFTGAQGARVRMAGARLARLRAAEADFSDGIFTGCRAPESIWEGAILDRADMTGMTLPRANFETARLHGTRLARSDMRRARLPESDLTGADLSHVNLFQGTLEGAHLEKTDFRGANLFEVEFYQSTVSGGDFRGANVKRTKLV